MESREIGHGFWKWGGGGIFKRFRQTSEKQKNQWGGKQYIEGGIQEKLKKLGIRENNNNSPRGGISDFEGEQFYGLRIDFGRSKSKNQEDLRNEIGSSEYEISTFGENAEKWKEAKLNLEEKKEELSNQIELSL